MTQSAVPPKPSSNWKAPAFWGYATILFAFAGMGSWSAYARIDAAVVASGVIVLESNRKTVQHFEGGIVREINVREGQRVDAGDVLFRLDATQGGANLSMVRNQLDSLVALEARLLAERDKEERVTFPEELTARRDDAIVARSIEDETNQFNERRSSLEGQIEILRSQIVQLGTEIDGLTQEREATQRQFATIEEELEDQRFLLEKELTQKSRVLSLEREKSRLEGITGRSLAELAKAEAGIGEAELQIRQLQRRFAEEVNTQLVETRQQISDLRERLIVADDVVRRLEVAAPRAGRVQDMQVFTRGAVIRPGEPLLDIVPEDEGLIVQAQVSPLDVDNVEKGMRAEVMMSSFQAQQLPVIWGQVQSISGDRLTDEQTGQPYFLTQIVVEDEDIPEELDGRLQPGLPADIIIPTGERTVLDYLVTPLRDRLSKAFREE